MTAPVIVPRPEHTISRRNIDADALKVLYRLHEHDYTAYLVGGSVRDLLLDSVTQLAEMLNLHTPQDWGGRFRQVYTVTDDLLLALIEEYE